MPGCKTRTFSGTKPVSQRVPKLQQSPSKQRRSRISEEQSRFLLSLKHACRQSFSQRVAEHRKKSSRFLKRMQRTRRKYMSRMLQDQSPIILTPELARKQRKLGISEDQFRYFMLMARSRKMTASQMVEEVSSLLSSKRRDREQRISRMLEAHSRFLRSMQSVRKKHLPQMSKEQSDFFSSVDQASVILAGVSFSAFAQDKVNLTVKSSKVVDVRSTCIRHEKGLKGISDIRLELKEHAHTSDKYTISRSNYAGYPLKKSYDNTFSEGMVNSFAVKMKSVGALVYKQECGTVFKVGTKYVMTAWHVVQQIVGQHIALDNSRVFVNFNESLVEQGGLIYYLTRNILWDAELDFAVLEIANPDNRLPQGLHLSSDENDYGDLDEVSLIGYGHPNKNGKHLDPRCQTLSPNCNKISRARQWLNENSSKLRIMLESTGKHPSLVETGYQGLDLSDKLIFHCYMQQGGSGSPALTNQNADSVRVVGMLTHELPEFYFHLADHNRIMIKDEYRFEMGTKMSSIYKWIAEKDKNLANDIFGTGKNERVPMDH